MFYYSNPYNDLAINPDSVQNDIKVNLHCDTFEYKDTDLDIEDQVDLIGIHFFLESFDESTSNIGNTDIQDEDIKGNLYINRTNFNEQFFRITFD